MPRYIEPMLQSSCKTVPGKVLEAHNSAYSEGGDVKNKNLESYSETE